VLKWSPLCLRESSATCQVIKYNGYLQQKNRRSQYGAAKLAAGFSLVYFLQFDPLASWNLAWKKAIVF
jgi:hypothetical protein